MNEARLRGLLDGIPLVVRLEVHDCLGSTNDEARRLAEGGAPEGTVVVADAQSEGRGRLGRRWHSPPAAGIYVSTLFRPPTPAREATRWTLGAAIAACDACRGSGAPSVGIRWPNDLLAGGRKVAGILAEAKIAGGSRSELVIGAGFNVNQQADEFPASIAGRATSLRILAGGGMLERESIVAGYLERLGEIARRLGRGDWAGVAAEWERRAAGARGAAVRIDRGEGRPEIDGITRGLGERGELLVERDDGERIEVHMAESVRYLEA